MQFALVSLLSLIGAAEPITEDNWRTHPRVVAVRNVVATMDAAATATATAAGQPAEPQFFCRTTFDDKDDDKLSLAVTVVTAPKTLTPRRQARVRTADPIDPDVPTFTDYEVTVYFVDDKPRFAHTRGALRSQFAGAYEVRTYFDDSGAPFWFVAEVRAGPQLHLTLARSSPPDAHNDWQGYPGPEPALFELWRSAFALPARMKPCTSAEADRLVAPDKDVDVKLVKKFRKRSSG